MPDRRLDASALRDWADRAVGGLLGHAEEINRLNVFPVADSDTGTNMLFTMRSALAGAEAAGAGGDVATTAAALSEGAARGARGNSGVILSQILRALAEVTTAAAATGRVDIDAPLLGAALRHGVALSVASMGGQLVAGTVISVLQAAAGAVEQAAAEGHGLGAALTCAADAAASALERTPEQLDVLAEAGVVDAGGRGLLVLLDALSETVTGAAAPRRGDRFAAAHRHRDWRAAVTVAAPEPEFEVMYLLGSCAPAALDALRAELDDLGDSVAVAASAGGHTVHVHTDDAGAAVEAGLRVAAVSHIRIAALAAGRVAPGGWSRRRAVLAIVDGDGAEQIFRSEGAVVLRPGTESVSPVGADQLLRALVDTDAAQVMVLPNGYIAAEELVAGCTAGIGCGIDVVPVPAGSMAQGLAALAVHDPARSAVDDGYAMARAAAAARHGSVRVAVETALTWAGTCRPGDGLGIAGEEVLVVAGDVTAAATGLIDLLLGAGGELVTVLIGIGAPAGVADLLADHVRRRHPGTEFASHVTGHRGDVLLIGVE